MQTTFKICQKTWVRPIYTLKIPMNIFNFSLVAGKNMNFYAGYLGDWKY